jgi:hypothetical protein
MPRAARGKFALGLKTQSLALAGEAVSAVGKAFVAELLKYTIADYPLRPTSVAKSEAALAALIADLGRAEALGRWGQRRLQNASFTGLRFGRSIFVPICQGLVASRCLDFVRGARKGRQSRPSSAGENGWNGDSLFKLTAKFWMLAGSAGITIDNFESHFADAAGGEASVFRPGPAPAVEASAAVVLAAA